MRLLNDCTDRFRRKSGEEISLRRFRLFFSVGIVRNDFRFAHDKVLCFYALTCDTLPMTLLTAEE